jgi:hypothetical protein
MPRGDGPLRPHRRARRRPARRSPAVHVQPGVTVAYYQAVQDRMGGLDATQRFARLFSGSTDDAANFVAVSPKHPVDDRYPWLGRFDAPRLP